MSEKSQYIARKMTLRYVIALGIIASVITAGYGVLVSQLMSNQNDGYVINISGMQRMLSQRIALISTQIDENTTQDINRRLIAGMSEAITKMADNHLALTTDYLDPNPDSDVYKLYHGELDLDQRVSHYLASASAFIQMYASDGASNWLAMADIREEIEAVARKDLLNDLDYAVSVYETKMLDKIDTYRKIETTIYTLGLAVLLVTALFIFRPMVRYVARTTEELEESNNELMEFSYRISHDLRAPIVSSLGLSKAAAHALKGERYDMVGEALSEVTSSMTKLERLIEDILELTRLKKTEPLIEEVNIRNMIDEILVKLKYLDEDESIYITIDVSGMPECICTHRLLLAQSLENLISNAIKYYDPNVDKPIIDISVSELKDSYQFSVRDNGMGIPENYRDKLFSMFKRFHPKVSFGSGLGLYLVQQQAKLLGGFIDYMPLKKGSLFALYIEK